jgi:hypothetical protein
MAATERARTAKRDEQAMTLAASQEARAVKGEDRAVSAEQRALLEEERRVMAAKQAETEHAQRMKIYPLEIQAKDLALRKAEQDLNGAMGEATMAQEALTKGVNPKTGQPLTAEDERALRARLAQATMAINAEATRIAQEKAEHEIKMKKYQADINQSNAAAEASKTTSGMSKFNKVAKIQVPGFTPMDKPTSYEVGMMNGLGQVRGKDGILYNNVNEAARAQGIGGAAAASPTTIPTAPAATNSAAPAKPTKKPDPNAFFRSSESPAFSNPMGD